MGLFSSECAHCGSKEHATSDCPHGIFSSKCAKCGSVDHATSDCPHGIFSSKCSKCGSSEHSTSDCPHGIFSSKCAKCGSTEHSTSDCPHGIFSSKCANCGSKNHSTADCPQGIFGKRTSPPRQVTSTSSSDESGCATMIGWLIGIVIVVIVVVWLAVNVVLPVALLNSALALAVLAFVFKKYNILFASLALVGGGYMLLDIINGWLSAIFVENVVKNPDWISAFVYINAPAIGLCVWFLIQPIWLKTEQMAPNEKRKSLLLKGALILFVVVATAVAPVIYHSVRNPFILKSQNNIFENEIEGDADAPVHILPNTTDTPYPNSNIPGIFPQASQRLLTSSELNGMSKHDLKIMRNEIFARHGYIFKTSEMKSYFSSQSWYHGRYEDVSSMLSDIEHKNVALIKSYE